MFRQILTSLFIGIALAAPSHDKICPKLENQLSTRGRANVVISFNEGTQAVINKINSLHFDSRGAKITAMKTELEELQSSSQNDVLDLLSTLQVKFHSSWINNKIYIEDATENVVLLVAGLSNVAWIREQVIATIPKPVVASKGVEEVEWNIKTIEADKAWNLTGGNQGEGVVVANIDTGVRGTHEALQSQFRTTNGWFDPYDGSDLPMDIVGVGTHTMGTIAGSGGIGVAPKAQWIACRGCSIQTCTETALIQCGQWIICPTAPNGLAANCSLAPRVVTNSWGVGSVDYFYDEVIDAWQEADIIPVFALGSGLSSGCGTGGSPGDHPNVIGAGGTTEYDEVAERSTRGPSGRDGVTIKPDLMAPAENVRSAWGSSDSMYLSISGTSMASPHISGTIALLLSENPNLKWQEVKNLLQDHADRNPRNTEGCGGIPPGQWPNHIYGYGRVNALKSLSAAIGN